MWNVNSKESSMMQVPATCSRSSAVSSTPGRSSPADAPAQPLDQRLDFPQGRIDGLEWDYNREDFANLDLCKYSDANGNTILHRAVELVEEFRERHRHVYRSDDGDVEVRDVDLYESLMRSSNIAARNNSGETALHSLVRTFPVRTFANNDTFLMLIESMAECGPEGLDEALLAKTDTGASVLHYACDTTQRDPVFMTRCLINRFPNLKEVVSDTDHAGRTAIQHLMESVGRHDCDDVEAFSECIHWLADHGADLCSRDPHNGTLLHILAGLDTHLPDVADRVMASGVDLFAADDFGNTALHDAAENPSCSDAFVNWLMEQSNGTALLGMRNGKGQTPSDVARAKAADTASEERRAQFEHLADRLEQQS
jgi:hypothetical protein